MQVIDPRELNDLAAFASRGGLGRGVATTDCVAEQPDQLMYLSGDALVLLRDLGPIMIASCEGVVGWVNRENVEFDRIAGSSSPSSIESVTPDPDLPRTIVHSPSPPMSLKNLPLPIDHEQAEGKKVKLSAEPVEDKRASNPFDLESPLGTPGVEGTEKGFDLPQSTPMSRPESMVEELREDEQEGGEEEEDHRMSMASDNSSSFGGIGGFMLGSPSPPASVTGHGGMGAWDSSPNISNMADSPQTPSDALATPQSIMITTPSLRDLNDLSPTSIKSQATAQSSAAWDIYDSYSRESMYARRTSTPLGLDAAIDTPSRPAAARQSVGSKAPSSPQFESGSPNSISRSSIMSSPTGSAYRNSMISNSSWDDEGRGFEAARLALQRVGAGRKWAEADADESYEEEPSAILGAEDRTRSPSPVEAPPRPARRRPMGMDGSSPNLSESTDVLPAKQSPETPKATPRKSTHSPNVPSVISTPARSILSSLGSDEGHRREAKHTAVGSIDGPLTPPRLVQREMNDDTPKRLRIANPDTDDEEDEPLRSAGQSSDGNHASVASTAIVTPVPPSEEQFTEPSPSPTKPRERIPSPEIILVDTEPKNPLLDSPLSMDESPRAKVQPIVATMPISESLATISLRSPPPIPSPPRRPSIAMSSALDKSPMRPPTTPWQTDSPSSPHSIEATRQAVEVVRKTPEAKRSRGLTLVGRMEADLGQSKGPVPITFIIGDSHLASSLSNSPNLPSLSSLGLGLPRSLTGGSDSNRISPGMKKSSSVQSSLASPLMDIDDPIRALKTTPSAYPTMRSATNPLPPPIETTSVPSTTNGMPKPGFFPRPRSRSFSAAVNKVMAKKAGPGLTIQTSVQAPPVPLPPTVSPANVAAAGAPLGAIKRPFFSRQSSMPQATLAPGTSNPSQPPTPISPAITLSPDIIGFINHANESTSSLAPPASARSSSFSFRIPRGSKTSLAPSTNGASLALPVSNKDYEDTVKADGLDFEIIQPKSKRIASSLSPSSSNDDNALLPDGAELERKGTVHSATSGRSLKTLPDTDEWGFIKEKSPTPEVFVGRAGGAGQRALEQKWLGIINTPLTGSSGPPKKVRKLAIESGIPASLRGRVWAWFMTPTMSARRPGLYQELLDHNRADKRLEDRIDSDVEAAYPDHSIYSESSTGQTDLRSILRAYSHFATGGYRPEMSLIAGMLLIHCVAEDAFWLLSGFVNGGLKDYYAQPTGVSGGKAVGMRIDAAVFAGVLAGSEPKLAKLFRDIGLHPIVFLEEWYAKLFLRCLPWPTALRIIDAVVAEGPRFLLIASLTILTLSRDRLLALPRTYTDVLAYLRDLPQDALLLPEGFMKACENVRFKEDDMRRLRSGVEKELGLVVS